MRHALTAEQQAILDAFRAGGSLKIAAGAGTGKSTMLRLMAESTDRRGTYVVFNRAAAEDAQQVFPTNVTVDTIHGLAYKDLGRYYDHRRGGPRLSSARIADILGIVRSVESRGRWVQPAELARLAMHTVREFYFSGDGPEFFDRLPELPNAYGYWGTTSLRKQVRVLAEKAWLDMIDPGGSLPFDHDVYLKMWQLLSRQLPGDFVLFDEAQDANGAVMAIIEQQTRHQLVVVGDQDQRLYEWRGALSAFAAFEAPTFPLTRSFRFGPGIADVANRFLRALDSDARITGAGPRASTVAPLQDSDVVLCRTNRQAFVEARTVLASGRKTALAGELDLLEGLAEAAAGFASGRSPKHPELTEFANWPEVQSYAFHDPGGSDLASYVKIVDEFGAEEVLRTLAQLNDEASADVAISTVHQAKGREWNTLRISDDFPAPPVTHFNPTGQLKPDQGMLAYVGVTRARIGLDIGGLAWIDEYLTRTFGPTRGPSFALAASIEAEAEGRHDDALELALEGFQRHRDNEFLCDRVSLLLERSGDLGSALEVCQDFLNRSSRSTMAVRRIKQRHGRLRRKFRCRNFDH